MFGHRRIVCSEFSRNVPSLFVERTSRNRVGCEPVSRWIGFDPTATSRSSASIASITRFSGAWTRLGGFHEGSSLRANQRVVSPRLPQNERILRGAAGQIILKNQIGTGLSFSAVRADSAPGLRACVSFGNRLKERCRGVLYRGHQVTPTVSRGRRIEGLSSPRLRRGPTPGTHA